MPPEEVKRSRPTIGKTLNSTTDFQMPPYSTIRITEILGGASTFILKIRKSSCVYVIKFAYFCQREKINCQDNHRFSCAENNRRIENKKPLGMNFNISQFINALQKDIYYITISEDRRQLSISFSLNQPEENDMFKISINLDDLHFEGIVCENQGCRDFPRLYYFTSDCNGSVRVTQYPTSELHGGH